MAGRGRIGSRGEQGFTRTVTHLAIQWFWAIWPVGLVVFLTACTPTGLIPAEPTVTPSPIAPTRTPLPLPPTARPQPSSSATLAATETPAATPTPAPPTTQRYTDTTSSVLMQLPADWIVESNEGVPLFIRARAPDDSALVAVIVDVPLDPDQFVAAFLGADAAAFQQEALPDGTRRFIGLDGQGRATEYRFRQVGDLMMAAAIAQNEPLPAAVVEAFWAGLRLFPSRAAALFDPPATVPTVRAGDLVVETGGMVTGSDGAAELLGEVRNTGSADAEGVRVTVELLSADGQVVASASGPLERELLLAGESSPFRLRYDPAPASWVGTRPSVTATDAQFGLRAAAFGLSAPEPQGSVTTDGSGYQISSSVSNEGNSPASFVRLIAALYDARGQVIGVGSTYAGDAPMEPGSARAVTLTITALAAPPGDVARVVVWADGKR